MYILLFFILLLLISSLRPKAIPGRMIFLFRAFFPSWKFYEDIGDNPYLFYRIGNEEWKPAFARPRRRLSSIFLNAEGNFLHACGSLLQHLVADIEEIEEEAGSAQKIESATSFQIVKKCVEYQIAENEHYPPGTEYQFRICLNQDELMTSTPFRIPERRSL